MSAGSPGSIGTPGKPMIQARTLLFTFPDALSATSLRMITSLDRDEMARASSSPSPVNFRCPAGVMPIVNSTSSTFASTGARSSDSSRAEHVRMDDRSARTNFILLPGLGSNDLPMTTTFVPRCARHSATARPMPFVPPKMHTVRDDARFFSFASLTNRSHLMPSAFGLGARRELAARAIITPMLTAAIAESHSLHPKPTK
mmetsp:Transcript_22255/g.65600  ORF Transcript_22255/g.65600 Transcript_22255/m.65600 type:complete len:201 (+) Transcript_22255:646-1248(+)